MARTKVLITVKAYPNPSRSYDELVCTAGVREDGSWIRIYPVPLAALSSDRYFKKYQWVELDLRRRTDTDFRPESYSPRRVDLSDLEVGDSIPTMNRWAQRKAACLGNVYTSMTKLVEDSRDPNNVSLATFRPTRIECLVVKSDDREWKKKWREQLTQRDLFEPATKNRPRRLIRKLPYKFKYRFVDENNRQSEMTIEDWEIGALYWKCLAASEGDESRAVEMVRRKYETEFLDRKEVYLFLGTTYLNHARRRPNPFTIIGVFYPPSKPRSSQGELFG